MELLTRRVCAATWAVGLCAAFLAAFVGAQALSLPRPGLASGVASAALAAG